MDIILLAHQARVLQGPAPRKGAVAGGREVAVRGQLRSSRHHPDNKLPRGSHSE